MVEARSELSLQQKKEKIIATGVNRVTSSCDPTAHAEVSAIRAAAAKLGTFNLSGYEIYTSCEPWPDVSGCHLLGTTGQNVIMGTTRQMPKTSVLTIPLFMMSWL